MGDSGKLIVRKGCTRVGAGLMLFEIIKDSVKLALIGIIILYVIQRYVRWRRPHWSESVEKHRLLILMVLGAVLLGIKLSEDAITGDSGPMDKAILLFIHKHVPAGLNSFFEALTLSGSFKFFVPLLILSSLVFAFLKKWFEVALVGASTACGGLVIYVIKAVIGRDRPTALVWVSLVGFSRLVLGVHWPTDVMAAACVGLLIPIALRYVLMRVMKKAGHAKPGVS